MLQRKTGNRFFGRWENVNIYYRFPTTGEISSDVERCENKIIQNENDYARFQGKNSIFLGHVDLPE
jgi:hypothetical protein